MTWTGGYVLDLYCDAPGHDPDREHVGEHGQFTAETGSECRAAARRAGWRLSTDPNEPSTCPRCGPGGDWYFSIDTRRASR